MTSLGECLHFNMKNILTWFSSKSHLNMLWFHMKLSHFDSPEPLSARIHLAFSFLQRAHIVELWAPTSGSQKPTTRSFHHCGELCGSGPGACPPKISDCDEQWKSPQKEGYCRYCRMVYFIHVSCFYSGALQAIEPCQPQSKKHMWQIQIILNILVVHLFQGHLHDHHSSWDKH